MISVIRASPSSSMPAGSVTAANRVSAMRETVGPVDWAESSTVTSSRYGSVRSNPAFGSGSASASRASTVPTRAASSLAG